MADATKVGNVYLEIRAQINKLSKDLAAAHKETQDGAKRIQATLDKGVNFAGMVGKATAAAGSIYAAFATISRGIEMAKIGATLEKQAQSFSNLSDAAGTSSKAMLDSLKGASRGLVAEADLMAAAGKAMLMNIPADKISELMKIAAATSQMTGQTITEAFNDITMGVARQSRMILDNLGIIVNVEKANEDYANALGKTSAALSDAEKRQAFMNAVLKAGDDMIRRLGTSSSQLDGVTRATAEWTDALNSLSKMIAEESNPLFEAIAGVLHRVNLEMKAGMQASKEYGSSIEAIDARIEELNKKYGDMEGRRSWGYNEPQDVEYRRLIARRKSIPLEGMTDFGRGNVKGRFGSLMPEYYGAKRVSENEISYDSEERWKAYEEQLKKVEDSEKKAIEERKRLQDSFEKDYRNAILSESQFAISEIDRQYVEYQKAGVDKVKIEEWYAAELLKIDNKVWEERQKLIDETVKLQKEAAKKEAEEYEKSWLAQAENENVVLMDKVKQYESTYTSIVDLTERTAEAMQDNFSNLFFDAMTGKLKTLEDYAKAVFDSIARMISDLSAQELTRGLFGPEMKGGGWLSSLGSIIGLSGGMSVGKVGGTMTASQTAASILPINTMAFQPFHSGGLVGGSGGGMRAIPASYYHSAPRLHNGLMPDEFPAILQKGERVTPKGRAGAMNNVTINVAAPNGRMDRESLSTLQSGLYAALSRQNRRNG